MYVITLLSGFSVPGGFVCFFSQFSPLDCAAPPAAHVLLPGSSTAGSAARPLLFPLRELSGPSVTALSGAAWNGGLEIELPSGTHLATLLKSRLCFVVGANNEQLTLACNLHINPC